MHLIMIVFYNHFMHKMSLCFISVYVKFTDLIAFVELGTGLNN